MKKNKIIPVVLPIVIVAVLGSVFVQLGMDWFNGLTKPSQWIPNFLIPIVWTVIYVTTAIIVTRWVNSDKLPKSTLILLIVNGVFNVLWCLVFFTLKQTLLGNVLILLNLILSIVLWVNIFTNKKIYAYILSVYPIWLSIATTLNLAIWILN